MEKPLHVRVAEVLGCKVVHIDRGYEAYWRCGCNPDYDPDIEEHGDGNAHDMRRLLSYDTDWSATGPLIERFQLVVWHVPGVLNPPEWRATCEYSDGSEAGDTPLLAVCNLVLALHAAGKLPPEAHVR